MIVSKITKDEVFARINQAELTQQLDTLNLPCLRRAGEYKSFHEEFEKFSGSRARCFSAGFFRHTFSELAAAESKVRGTKLSKADITNLHERLAQILCSFFGYHPKNPVRVEYKSQFEKYLRTQK